MKSNFSKVSTNFSKGLNTAAPHMIDPNEVQISENFLYDKGVPYVRQGTAVNASLPYPVVSMKKFYKKAGSSYFVAFAGGQLYQSNVSGIFNSVSSEMISGNIQTAVYSDNLYFTNYSTVTKFFDGSSIDLVGLSSPIFRKVLEDFESPSVWVTLNTTSGDVTTDTNYTHIDLGTQAIQFRAYDPGNVAYFYSSGAAHYNDLSKFALNVSSDTNDLIQLYTVHGVKANISSFLIILVNANAARVYSNITTLSTWISCSNDFYGLTHTIPKSLFTQDAQSSGFIWTSARVDFNLTPVSNSVKIALVSIDNVRMVKTPPLLNLISSPATSSTLFFGSSINYPYQVPLLCPGGFTCPPGDPQYLPYAQVPVTVGAGNTIYVPYASVINDPTLNPTYRQALQGLQLQGTTVSGAQLPNDIYYYKITFAKKGPGGIEIESNPCYQTSGIAVSSNASSWNTVQLTNIPIAPVEWNVSSRKVYRRPQSDSFYRYVYTIADNSTTSFIDNIPSTILGQNLEEDHWPPPQAKYIFTATNQRIYFLNLVEEGIAQPSRLRWSKPYQPHYCPLTNVIDISPNDGTEATGIFQYLTLLYILKERSTWLIDETGNLIGLNDSVGCIAPLSIAKGENEVFWLSEQGIIKFTLQFKNITKNRNIMDTIIQRLPKAYISNATGIYYNGFYFLSVTDQGSTVNNLTLVYDNINDKWSTFPNLNINTMTTWQGYKDGYRLFYGNNSGMINEFLTGNYDISSPIYSRIRTKEFGRPTPTMAFRKAYIHTQELDGGNRQYQITPYFDFTSSTVDLQTTSGTYSLVKTVFPATQGASFCSVEIISSGRYQLNQLDLEGKEEEER